ncbi:nitrite reductase (NAD(P)H) small subunit [Chitinophagaceae bacterium 26-R-25]|nr:nitrite reductase (NAD(P)H) small subunit [Chitinophagaceae bacterium 26-R-25]
MANYKWHKIADAVEEIYFGENNIAVAEADGKTICVAKYKDELFAFAYKCPHASGIMADGFIDALGNVVCPLHRYKFCITNGRNVSGEGYYLKHWPVRIEDEKVYVGFEEKNFLKWL